jgi:hypothetical protein
MIALKTSVPCQFRLALRLSSCYGAGILVHRTKVTADRWHEASLLPQTAAEVFFYVSYGCIEQISHKSAHKSASTKTNLGKVIIVVLASGMAVSLKSAARRAKKKLKSQNDFEMCYPAFNKSSHCLRGGRLYRFDSRKTPAPKGLVNSVYTVSPSKSQRSFGSVRSALRTCRCTSMGVT